MRFLEKLFKKTNTKHNNRNQDTYESKEVAFECDNHMPDNKPAFPIGLAVPNTKTPIKESYLDIHQDIRDLIWIADGSYKNYNQTVSEKIVTTIEGISITVSLLSDEEPSLIYLKLPITDYSGSIERPPYYPSYRELTPAQRGIYWKLLANPYDKSIDIGYVFVLYYGLERFLLTEKYEAAIDVILKLRDVHTNKSFQTYTANAVILTCLQRKRADVLQRFLNSLDKEHEYNFTPNLFLLCKYALGIPLKSSEIMRMARAFEFTKNNYIKNYPKVFLKLLSVKINEKYNSDSIPWNA